MSSERQFEEIAEVIALDGKSAWIASNIKTGCQSCQVNTTCGTGIVSNLLGKQRFTHKINNTLSANVGDRVMLRVPEKGVLALSLLIYIVPLFVMVAAALLLQQLKFVEPLVMVGSIAALLVSFVILKSLSENSIKRFVSSIEMVAIMPKAGS
ncbi:MAG: SoxR reducing system RseC family protein [Kangiellaceae bacterium]|jgi:sigma-E factor negative regulatory protein RseC|nr:SoxR reducing system RseC family protein [Kangiellaceae bacterium]